MLIPRLLLGSLLSTTRLVAPHKLAARSELTELFKLGVLTLL